MRSEKESEEILAIFLKQLNENYASNKIPISKISLKNEGGEKEYEINSEIGRKIFIKDSQDLFKNSEMFSMSTSCLDVKVSIEFEKNDIKFISNKGIANPELKNILPLERELFDLLLLTPGLLGLHTHFSKQGEKSYYKSFYLWSLHEACTVVKNKINYLKELYKIIITEPS